MVQFLSLLMVMKNSKDDNVNDEGVKDSQLSNLLEKLSIDSDALNPSADEFKPAEVQIVATKDVPKNRTKPIPVGKQRKSNVNLENPENEFLKSQLETCKGLIAQKDLELKKLKESNDLRGKQITNLESLLQEARNFINK